jgi:hypothetical protein
MARMKLRHVLFSDEEFESLVVLCKTLLASIKRFLQSLSR